MDGPNDWPPTAGNGEGPNSAATVDRCEADYSTINSATWDYGCISAHSEVADKATGATPAIRDTQGGTDIPRMGQADPPGSHLGNSLNERGGVTGYPGGFPMPHADAVQEPSTYALSPGARGYRDILASAELLTSDATTGAIESLIREAARLTPIQREHVYKAIKKRTGLPMAAIREAADTAPQGAPEKPDHLTLARSVIGAVGEENIIGTQSHVWLYQTTGIWRPLEPRGEKQVVQNRLAAAHGEERITRQLVDSVTETLRTEVYQPDHAWNVGPADAVVAKNGELVLRNGQWFLEPHCREYYRTVLVPVDYDHEATCPQFLRFLQEVFAENTDQEDKCRSILEMIGYTLMSHAKWERFVLLVGNGANGKSVLLSVIEALCGPEHVAGVQPSEFGNKHQRAHLHLRLANIVTEIKEGEVISDAALKSIVSGEPTTVEHKFRDPFEFRPYATCWFSTNHLPRTRDFSDALFRRALVVPFNRKFTPGVDADVGLKDKLISELPGIMHAALHAYAGVLERGSFTEPESCTTAKKEWRQEADQAAQFLEECCEVGAGEVQSSDLYNVYCSWAVAAGIQRKLRHKSFTQRLERLGYQRVHRNKGRFVLGLKLNAAGMDL